MPFPFKVIENVTLRTRVSELDLGTTRHVQVPLELIPEKLKNVPMRDAFYLDAPVNYLTSRQSVLDAPRGATLGKLGEREGFYRVDPSKF